MADNEIDEADKTLKLEQVRSIRARVAVLETRVSDVEQEIDGLKSHLSSFEKSLGGLTDDND